MNAPLIGQLIRLRYKLMWARTRTRNGKVALFFVGYLLLVLLIALLTSGGVGAAELAVRSGKALTITRIVLTSLYAQALLATIMMGFGMSAIFSEYELRRYPVTALERRLARHLIGIIDPFWILTLALEFGLVVGLSLLGGANFLAGLAAILLLLVANYLTARLIETALDRLMQQRSGSMLVMVAVLCLSLSGAAIPPLLKAAPGIVPVIVRILSYTPPFGAAAAMTQSGLASLYGFAVEIWWLVGLTAALVWMERRPPVRRAVETTAMSFESRYDRVAAALGFDHAPLVGWWLRFYARNSRFKAMILISVPVLAFLTYNIGGRKGGIGLFPAALGVIPIATFLAPARFMVNQFGYLGGGYRRFFLLPVEPATVLRTGSYASMLLSVGFIPLAVLAWIVLGPGPRDGRHVFMLLASGFTGLFTFHALGLWTTLYGPRRGNYNQSLGNDLSLLGNIVLIGGVLVCMFGSLYAHKAAPGIYDPANWWMWTAPPAAAALFYWFSLRAASQALPARREALMAIVEGRA